MKMDYNAEVIRGWPYDGSLDLNEPIKSGSTLFNGDWVIKQSDNTVGKNGSTATSSAGLVIQGNGDSASAVNSNKAVVLWGNFIAKIANYDATATYAPGTALTVKSGKLTAAAAPTSSGGNITSLGDPVIGFVLSVIAGSSTNTASLVVKI